jgi:hypothetical protein
MPIKSGVLSHLQSAYQEILNAIVTSTLINPLVVNGNGYYCLYGCINNGSGLNYDISVGAIYDSNTNEIYLVDATTFTASSGNVAVGKITTTFFSGANADPITFTDSVSRNVLQIRKIVFANGASGSGDVDFGSLKLINDNLGSHIVGAAGQPAFQNSFANVSGTALSYVRKNLTSIFLSGNVTGQLTSGTTPRTIFTLPTGYRPVKKIFSSVTYVDSGTYKIGMLTIDTSGNVKVETGTSNQNCDSCGININFDILFG